MKKLYAYLAGLQAFVGVGAMFGGGAAILNPQSPLGAPAEILKNSPFTDFFIPGIILFAVLGLGGILSALSIFLKFRYRAYIANVVSWALIIWIVVQCVILGAVAALHIIFFAIGALEALLSMIVLFKEQLFPANLILNIYKRNSKEM